MSQAEPLRPQFNLLTSLYLMFLEAPSLPEGKVLKDMRSQPDYSSSYSVSVPPWVMAGQLQSLCMVHKEVALTPAHKCVLRISRAPGTGIQYVLKSVLNHISSSCKPLGQPVKMVRQSLDPENPKKSCKSRGSGLHAHFNHTCETARASEVCISEKPPGTPRMSP